ncbi:MAG: hypothetical protein OEW29_10405, partial [Acidimicrobiia bacterium]|nr:hypothetical protein [Acidimicrobiia bacterium]
MIPCPNLLRGRFVPVAILAAIVALIATSVAWNHDEGSDLETIGDASTPDVTDADVMARSADIPGRPNALDLIGTSPTLPGDALSLPVSAPPEGQAAVTATPTADGAATESAAGTSGGSTAAQGPTGGTPSSTSAATTKPTAPPTAKAPATTAP